jgi:hypothetical protein
MAFELGYRGAHTWLEVCATFAKHEGVRPDELELLATFRSADPRGGPPPPAEPRFEGAFTELERALLEGAPFAAAADSLGEDVDPAQAEMFARRLLAVDRALADVDDASGRLLRVGLRMRTLGILAAPGPRALRLRALADFYYSHLGRHLQRCRGERGPTITKLGSALEWREAAAALEHARLDGPSDEGPVHVNLLRVDPARVRIEAHDCREALERGLDFAGYSRALAATAAVSGGFFLYSEPDIRAPSARYDPIGLLLSEGQIASPPIFARGSLLVTDSGAVELARIGLDATTLHVDGHTLALAGYQTRAHARVGAAVRSVAIVGSCVVAVGSALEIPLNGYVLPIPTSVQIQVGAPVSYGQLRCPSGAIARSGIAGGPMLLEAGQPTLDMRREDFWGSAPPVTFSQDETGDQNLLPRLAAGLDHEGRLVLAAIDGRNFDRALGMTLAGVGRLLAALGCHVVVNLDGGSSKRMVLHGETLDLASTEIRSGEDSTRIRPVHTGLFMFAGPADLK